MKIANTTEEYRWGDQMTPELREKLEREIKSLNDLEAEVNRRDLANLSELSNTDVFLLWLRA